MFMMLAFIGCDGVFICGSEATCTVTTVRAPQRARAEDVGAKLTDALAELAGAQDRAAAVTAAAVEAEQELRERMDHLQAELDATVAQAQQARGEALEAHQAADALRAVLTMRRARGLLARLRVAWRGE
jgi:hypothetical protein